MLTYNQAVEIIETNQGGHKAKREWHYSGKVSEEDRKEIEEMRQDLNAYKEKGAVFLAEIETMKLAPGEKVRITVTEAVDRDARLFGVRGRILGDYPRLVLLEFKGRRDGGLQRECFLKADIIRGAVRIERL